MGILWFFFICLAAGTRFLLLPELNITGVIPTLQLVPFTLHCDVSRGSATSLNPFVVYTTSFWNTWTREARTAHWYPQRPTGEHNGACASNRRGVTLVIHGSACCPGQPLLELITQPSSPVLTSPTFLVLLMIRFCGPSVVLTNLFLIVLCFDHIGLYL